VIDASGARILLRSGLIRPLRPDRVLGMALAVKRWGVSPATGYAAGAARHPDRVALVDDVGSLTFRDVDRRSDRIAADLVQRGVRSGDAVGLLARNGRGFVESTVALAKCGADVLYLGTATAKGQLREVLAREGARMVVHDEEFDPPYDGVSTEELSALADSPGPRGPRSSGRTPRQVILTSGTTGAPRGAARNGASPEDLVAALDRLPLRAGETTVLAAPVFHAWGLGHLSLGMVLGSTLVLRRVFDPAQVLRDVEQTRATALVVVPVMLDKLLAADPSSYDLSSLRLIASSGGSLPGDLVERSLAAFGPVLHNLYGSTEVAYAAVATPDDLSQDPRCAGKPPHGVSLRVVDEAGDDVPTGETGRIFVGSKLSFGGYTDGSDKDRLGALLSTGDLGRLDSSGRLTVLGRDDDMVVIGGENVFTGQVEQVLLSHDAVADVAVVDVPDDTYGQRLVAHVVTSRSVDAKELQDLVVDELAKHAMPREVRFHDELPRNATGKVLKRELRTSVRELRTSVRELGTSVRELGTS
jgi:fatty-acyl-CoA synthase